MAKEFGIVDELEDLEGTMLEPYNTQCSSHPNAGSRFQRGRTLQILVLIQCTGQQGLFMDCFTLHECCVWPTLLPG
jgi:hypothetical protein